LNLRQKTTQFLQPKQKKVAGISQVWKLTIFSWKSTSWDQKVLQTAQRYFRSKILILKVVVT
jgi:hypothetical protein